MSIHFIRVPFPWGVGMVTIQSRPLLDLVDVASQTLDLRPGRIPALTPASSGAVPLGPEVKPPAAINQFALGKPIQGCQVAKVLKDGTKLCQSFQHGQCKNKAPCSMGQHRCGLVIKKERVCGSGGHGAASCKQTSKLG